MASIYGVSQVSEILPNLYLTSVYGATRENILKKGISLLVNAAQELPKQELPGLESIKLFLDDTPYATIHVYFERIADKIHEHLSRGGRAMVHCVLGVSRSTSLVLAYLMKYRSMSLKSAFDLVSSRRPCVRPNPGFWRQLNDYERTLFNKPYITTSSSSSSNNERSYNNKTDTSIPITIVSSSNRNKPNVTSSSSYLSSSSSSAAANGASNYSASIPVYHDYTSYNSRPFSASRYSFDRNNNPNTLSKSISYKQLEKNIEDQFAIPSSMQTRYLSPGQHRTIIVNDDPIGKKNPNFSTTYRTSYGRY